MEQIITAPDEAWISYIAKLWVLGGQIAEEITGQKMDDSLQDLSRLQTILNSGKILVENTQELHALGILFGMVLINELHHYDWWIYEDEYGKDVCLRYKETSLVVFPMTMISNRIEDGEIVEVVALFHDLKAQLECIKNENYADQ